MAKITYKLGTTNDILASILKWKGRGKAVKEEGQAIAIAIMEKMEKDGDYTCALPLFKATDELAKGLGLAMREYFLAFTWLAYDEDSKKFVKDKSKVMKVAEAKAQKFWAMERPVKATPFDAQKAVHNLLKRAIKENANLENVRQVFLNELTAAKAEAEKLAAVANAEKAMDKRRGKAAPVPVK